jgi:hypothetical protein
VRRIMARSPDRSAEYLVTGNLDPRHAPPIGYAHLTTVAEFRDLLAARFHELELVGAESFTAAWQALLRSQPPEKRRRAGWTWCKRQGVRRRGWRTPTTSYLWAGFGPRTPSERIQSSARAGQVETASAEGRSP